MLSETTVVKVTRTLERLYTGTMTVVEHTPVTKTNHSTGFTDTQVLTDQPCRLSFSSSPSATDQDPAKVAQSVKVFYSPTVTVQAGSKVTVTQNGVTSVYKSSGIEAVYDTHKEINLEIFDGWA